MHAARMPTSLTPGFGASETSSRRPSPASGGSGSSTASPPPAASMGTTASSKLSTAQAQPSQQRRQRQQYRATTTGREHGDDGIEQAEYGTGPASSGGSGSSTTATTTGREHGDDGIEQAGYGTSAVARPEAAVAPPPTEAIYQQVSSADYGQTRSKRQPHRRRKHRVSVANETRGDVVSWSR
ncbi:hypothetical protein PF007_g17670 [Phytophthora fragariae]|uniref:Uncharacterized protein n=1 Tax=Phytophthora fragariae TaxID=53985 RepID=A0A6A3RDA8_9STRA|nr:hypothetical protein PF007_g17670 [Phytophthora fragariae]